jgi:hypothetical protein
MEELSQACGLRQGFPPPVIIYNKYINSFHMVNLVTPSLPCVSKTGGAKNHHANMPDRSELRPDNQNIPTNQDPSQN